MIRTRLGARKLNYDRFIPFHNRKSRFMSTATIPEQARVVIIGGGIIGCSVAYHLADMCCADVVLLERDQLTSGTTWHAAGLMTTYGSGSETIMRV
jgi:NADPH-dependent 2,4-dienoyl-CoA reductase/sulfur reductase-like enzyme